MHKSYSSNESIHIITKLDLKLSNTIVLIANILAKPNFATTIIYYTIIDEYILLYQYQYSFIYYVTINIIYNTYILIVIQT